MQPNSDNNDDNNDHDKIEDKVCTTLSSYKNCDVRGVAIK